MLVLIIMFSSKDSGGSLRGLHTQSMDVDEDSDQIFDLLLPGYNVRQHMCLKAISKVLHNSIIESCLVCKYTVRRVTRSTMYEKAPFY